MEESCTSAIGSPLRESRLFGCPCKPGISMARGRETQDRRRTQSEQAVGGNKRALRRAEQRELLGAPLLL